MVDWSYSGQTNATVGTGATMAEKGLAYASALVSPLLYLGLYVQGTLVWTWWQYAVAVLIGADLAAGVVANALNSCKRFYHTPFRDDEPSYVRPLKKPLRFTALHIYPLLIAVLYADASWIYGLVWYALLLVSALVVLAIPLYLRRPVATVVVLLAVMINAYLILPPAGFEWFAPVLLLKIVLGHLVQEEPYRPENPGVSA